MATSQNALQDLQTHITDYEGYAKIDSRQQSDKEMRLFLIKKIRRLVHNLSQDISTQNAADEDRLEALISSTSRKLVTIHQSLKTPTYIDEYFFKSASIPDSYLSRIYDLENNMLLEISSIREELVDLTRHTKDREAVEDHFLHIDAYVDNINQALFEREALILGDA
jgi:hypothetical protein